jgi:hypothetical protein
VILAHRRSLTRGCSPEEELKRYCTHPTVKVHFETFSLLLAPGRTVL